MWASLTSCATVTATRTSEAPRVLLVGPSPSSTGGIASFTSALSSAISDIAEVRSLAFRKLYPSFTRAGANGGGVVKDAPLVPWSYRSWRRACVEAKEFDPDVAIVQWWHPLLGPSLGYLARRLRARGCRVIFVAHNAKPHERFPATRLLTKKAFAQASEIVALSEHVANEIASMFDQAVSLLPFPPVISTPTKPASVHGSPVILFFGYVRPYKGLADLFRAFSLYRVEHSSARLIVAGSFIEPVDRYRKLAFELGIEHAVELRDGFISDPDVIALIRACDVLVLPYRSASQSGIVPLAQSLGARIVATTVGALSKTQGAVLVPPRDPRALELGLERALGLPKPAPTVVTWEAWRAFVSRDFESAWPIEREEGAWRNGVKI
ncbi:MAG: glycosyltransferase [Actinomycetota bacterium]